MPDTNETQSKHPLLAAREKVRSFVSRIGDAFTPTPPPPTEYRIVKTGERSLDAEMTTLAAEGWRFLAITPDGMLMGRNHKAVVEIAGEVEVYHRNNSVPWNYTTHRCCNHKCSTSPIIRLDDEEEPEDRKITIKPIPFCDGIQPIKTTLT
jgi:hypothetical protein